MTSLIHLAATVDTLVAWFTTMSVALADILSISAILIALNTMSNLIKNTYRAGYFVGRIFWVHIVPVILLVADGISWVNSFIDWEQVASDLFHYTKALVAFVITAAEQAVPTIESITITFTDTVLLSEVITTVNTAIVNTIATVIKAIALDSWSLVLHLVAITEPQMDYTVLTVKELKALAADRGVTIRSKARKAELIAALTA